MSKYDGSQFINYTTEDGLSSNVCNFIVEHENYLYFGTPEGLNRFDGETFKVYTANDGLAATAVWNSLKDSKGNLWFGSANGVTRYNPRLDTPNLVPPPVNITRLRILEKDTSVTSGLKLGYQENNLRIDYVGICLTSPEEVVYHYNLEGLDQDWHETTEHYMTYPYLPPGEYTFKVKARNNDGIWSEGQAELAFVILPPFWATIWFRGSIIAVVLLILWGVYEARTRNMKKKGLELERKVKERTKDLEKEKNKSDELLHNILPAEVVKELKEKGVTTPRRYEVVSILFTDFKGFTVLSSTLPPEKLVEELNDIFNQFDQIIHKYGLEKLKTVGDSYMIGGGLPVETEDHALDCIKAALEMQGLLDERNKVSAVKWQMRAGIHSGTVVAGVVGTKKFTYDVWGDTVNIANRIESACEEGRVNISAYTYDLVKDIVDCEYRGKVDVKGKGEIDMYFVSNIK